MLSHKNKPKSFQYEEEIDHSKKNFVFSNTRGSKKNSLADSLENLNGLGHELTFQLAGETCKYSKIDPVYMELFKPSLDSKTNIHILPKWIERKYFEMFLRHLHPGSHQATINFDLSACKKLVDICVYFKATEPIQSIIQNNVQTNIDKQTCLKIIKDYINLIYEKDYKSIVIELIQICIEVASKNIFYLINNLQDELFDIGEDSLEEIIEKYFESVILNTNIDHSLIMRVMMKNRRINDIFDLLENERKRSIATFETIFQEGLQPTIVWKIKSDNPQEGFYKESEEFTFENVSIILINYYDANKDVYNMALKICDVKSDVTLTEDKDYDDTLANVNSPNGQGNCSQFIISILSICEIKEINFKSKINFNCIFSTTKTKVLVCRIENFSSYFKSAGRKFDILDYSLQIYFNISYNFSSVLTHICKNFYQYHSLNSISKISKNVLNIILKNEQLNIRSEDEVLYSVLNWINNKQNVNNETILDIGKNINWSAISLDTLIDCIITESKTMMTYEALKGLIISEFSRRFKQEYAPIDYCSNRENLLEEEISCRRVSPHPNQSVPNFTNELLTRLIKIACKYDTDSVLGRSEKETPIYKASSEKLYGQSASSRNPVINNENSSHRASVSPQGIFSSRKPTTQTPENESRFTLIKKRNLHKSGLSTTDLKLFNQTKANSRKRSTSPLDIESVRGDKISNTTKQKVFQFNLLAQSKGKLGSSKTSLLRNTINVNSRQKTPKNRSLVRESSEQNIFKLNTDKNSSAQEQEKRLLTNANTNRIYDKLNHNYTTKHNFFPNKIINQSNQMKKAEQTNSATKILKNYHTNNKVEKGLLNKKQSTHSTTLLSTVKPDKVVQNQISSMKFIQKRDTETRPRSASGYLRSSNMDNLNKK